MKKVKFDDNIITYTTYSSNEYDRYCIDSIIYQRSYNRISDKEWNEMLQELFQYKTYDMIVHVSNIVINKYSNKQI